jgi:flagellar basal body-associated protein FliL
LVGLIVRIVVGIVMFLIAGIAIFCVFQRRVDRSTDATDDVTAMDHV